VDLATPKDYKEAPPPIKKQNSSFAREEEKKNQDMLKEIEAKHQRIDGKKLTEK